MNDYSETDIDKENSKKRYLLLLFLVLFIVVIFTWLWSSKSKQKGDLKIGNLGKQVNCYKTASDKVENLDGWVGKLYSAPLRDESSNRGTKDSGKREFSLKAMEGRSGDSIYLRLERAGFEAKDYVTGVKVVLEVCDENNKTSEFYSVANTKLQPAGEKISATVIHLHNNPKIYHPGKHRVDAFMNIDGKWILINRIDNIVLLD